MLDKANDIRVPPELVKPWMIPTTIRIDFLKKFILNFILDSKVTKKIEKIITADTKKLKLIKVWKFFNMIKPTIIDGATLRQTHLLNKQSMS